MGFDEVRGTFGDKVLAALDELAHTRQESPIDTIALLIAMARIDVDGDWQRLWLEFGELTPAMSQRFPDPAPFAGDLWRGRPMTGTVAVALHASAALAAGSRSLPVSPGMLGLVLVGRPSTGASCALTGGSPPRWARLLDVFQRDVVGGNWPEIQPVLKFCYERAEALRSTPMPTDDDPSTERWIQDMSTSVAERFKRLADLMNQLVRAERPAERSRLVAKHPELLNDDVDAGFVKLIADAKAQRDMVAARRYQDRLDFLREYRRQTW
ncbi:hypothetical protein GCM10009677_31570 [Sphaerisporangium rubeum]|uniref:Uncharacterized protein n=1 Tax=Sphaerisporangium rubeum TaxID=321317 RepID=A0A7X0M5R5_9ACTN|nr:hypothetical protein [Sphaerisporangium rubeum]MBB6472457.1 hypothetical protein [Sphaerisporangium rubeum]